MTDAEAGSLLVHFGRQEAEEQTTPEPAEVPDAEVEELDEPVPSPH